MPRLLDLFSGAGGAAVGYARAGFTEIVGVDYRPQPRYPFEFHCADALEFLRGVRPGDFGLIHASPPCQRYCRLTPQAYKANHPDLIAPVREALKATGIPYVIENVEDARRLLVNPVRLCGTMFGLNIWRHRYFECSEPLGYLLPACLHVGAPVLISGTPRRKGLKRAEPSVPARREAIGIDWMTGKELDDAIPPAFTEWIGLRMLEALREESRAAA